MAEYTSIRVTQEAKSRAEESKRDGETWNDYLQRCTENPPEVREYLDVGAFDEELARRIVDRLPEHKLSVDGVQEQLDRIERAATTAEGRTGAIDQRLDDAGLGR